MNKKLIVALALVATFAFTGSASAVTIAELQAQIAQLTAQLAALSGTTGTSSAVPTITSNLTIGSRGAEVSALQQYLIDGGYMNWSGALGYFGSITKTAVAAWQAANGVSPASGYFGPISRAKLATMVATTPTTGTGTGTTGTVTMDGTDGSITASRDSYVGNQTLAKGETKDIYAVKLQATAGDVTMTRFDVRMNVRPWLYFNKLVLKDTSGTVIAEKVISGASDATELTVGSDYLVRLDNLSYVVKPGDPKIVVVSASVLPTTDKLAADVTVTVQAGSNGIRTVNGKGYTDSLSVTDTRTVTLSSSGSTGNIVARNSATSPAKRIVTTTTSGETKGVVLGVYDFKSENQGASLNTLNFKLEDNGSIDEDYGTIFKRIWIDDGSRTWYASSIASTTAFTNLDIDLTKDTWRTLTIKADVADADDFTNNTTASSSMVVNTTNIVGVDDNFNTVTATGANTIAGNAIVLLQSGVSLSDLKTTVSNIAGANGIKGATSTVSFTFKVQNTGSNDVYVSASPNTFLATSTTAVLGSLTSMTSDETDSTGDVAGTHYVIRSNSYRTFNVVGTYGNEGGTAGLKTFTISTVYFDDDTTGLQEFNVNYGLEKYYVIDYQAAS